MAFSKVTLTTDSQSSPYIGQSVGQSQSVLMDDGTYLQLVSHFGNKRSLYHSTDGGLTWTIASGTLPTVNYLNVEVNNGYDLVRSPAGCVYWSGFSNASGNGTLYVGGVRYNGPNNYTSLGQVSESGYQDGPWFVSLVAFADPLNPSTHDQVCVWYMINNGGQAQTHMKAWTVNRSTGSWTAYTSSGWVRTHTAVSCFLRAQDNYGLVPASTSTPQWFTTSHTGSAVQVQRFTWANNANRWNVAPTYTVTPSTPETGNFAVAALYDAASDRICVPYKKDGTPRGIQIAFRNAEGGGSDTFSSVHTDAALPTNMGQVKAGMLPNGDIICALHGAQSGASSGRIYKWTKATDSWEFLDTVSNVNAYPSNLSVNRYVWLPGGHMPAYWSENGTAPTSFSRAIVAEDPLFSAVAPGWGVWGT